MRLFRITAVLVCALAHSMWIGAAWHAAEHQHALEQLDATVRAHALEQPQIDAGGDDDGPCPVCQIGALQTIAAAPVSVSVPALQPEFAAREVRTTRPALATTALPPSRGPPAPELA